MSSILSLLLCLFLPSNNALASPQTFTKAFISMNGFALDEAKSLAKAKCSPLAGSNPDKPVTVIGKTEHYEFSVQCQDAEVGRNFDLIVSKDQQEVTIYKDVSSIGGDVGFSYETQAWIQDLNKDGFADLVVRTKMKETHKKPNYSKDKLRAFLWNQKEKRFVDKKISSAMEQTMKGQFPFREK
ncbi:MAG: hypothetical protein AAF203_03115 [Pseudomonadota bacterium]